MNMLSDIKERRDGYNIKRLREILAIKQEDLADRLGLTQQAVSKIEQKDILEDEVLEKIAKAMNVSPETIKNFDDEATVNIISNIYQDDAVSYAVHYKCTFNPLDKVVELYERMLKAEQEKVALLEKMLKDYK